MNTKKCIICNLELDISSFHFRSDSNKYRNECKKCFYDSRKEYRKEYRKKEKVKAKEKIYNNLEKTKDKQNKWKKENKKHLLKYHKEYKVKNVEKIKNINNRYYYKNKEKILVYAKNYKSEKYKNDPLFKLTKIIRSNIRYAIKKYGLSKSNKTEKILGCSFKEFKIYIESKFEKWMSWENHGKYNGEFNHGWDIDHIIPLSSAKNEEDLINLNHYTNLQPLDSHINRNIKRDN